MATYQEVLLHANTPVPTQKLSRPSESNGHLSVASLSLHPSTDPQNMDERQRRLDGVTTQLRELLNDKCPRCLAVFLDFTGCCALRCPRCACGFNLAPGHAGGRCVCE